MLTLYFSGTGNTKYVAERFSKQLQAACHSIEENIHFASMIKEHDCICVCYPIYASRVPLIFQEFVKKYKKSFRNKKVIILVTQYLFSGDGARAFTDLFGKNYFQVIYAEHIFMPNNICNFMLMPIKNGVETKKMIQKADKRISKICEDVAASKTVKRGFHFFSRFIGLSQGLYAESVMNSGKKSVVIYKGCTKCEICIKNCPMSNLKLVDNQLTHNDNCTVCYRCVNLCPKKAISAFIRKRPKKQYRGLYLS